MKVVGLLRGSHHGPVEKPYLVNKRTPGNFLMPKGRPKKKKKKKKKKNLLKRDGEQHCRSW